MTGWRRFPAEPAVIAWLDAVDDAARATSSDPAHGRWWRQGGTWFAGVDALPNDEAGRVGQGPPLSGAALADAETVAGPLPLHPAQVSVVMPGYPAREPDETDAQHRYRRIRAAAHLDGLKADAEGRRRVSEPHAWILGLPLDPMRPGRSPLVVWEGSHEIIRDGLSRALAPHPSDTWGSVDVTDAYRAARLEVFERCRRVEVTAERGEAILLHRLAIHGIAPWEGAGGAPRAAIYFRPILPGGVADWLSLP
ncbi:hypothetical protein HKCCE2091_05415 [Rhodobacterales bacterium HKCCE2091]|nr:hypothetical protein [Rhodobacterales bacterium HKCCE2091]